jgi:hypothetical protein
MSRCRPVRRLPSSPDSSFELDGREELPFRDILDLVEHYPADVPVELVHVPKQGVELVGPDSGEPLVEEVHVAEGPARGEHVGKDRLSGPPHAEDGKYVGGLEVAFGQGGRVPRDEAFAPFLGFELGPLFLEDGFEIHDIILVWF